MFIFIAIASETKPNHQNLLPYFEGVSDWKKLGVHLLPEKYTSLISDIDKTYKQDVNECKWALIREYLKVGNVSWDKVIDALKMSDHPSIAEKIQSDIFNMGDVSARSSTNHEKNEQSHNTTGKTTECYVPNCYVIIYTKLPKLYKKLNLVQGA